MARGVLLGPRTANKVLRITGDSAGVYSPSEVERPDMHLRFFRLLEDFVSDGPAWADWVSRTSDTSRGTMQIYCYGNILDGAMAGYKGIVSLIDGEWVPPVNPCKTTCTHSAFITGTPPVGVGPSGVPPEGNPSGSGLNETFPGTFQGSMGTGGTGLEETFPGAFQSSMGTGPIPGEPYSFTPSIHGIDPTSISATGLPPGLSIDDTTGEISGTPTATGTFGVVVTGTTPLAGDEGGARCTVTKYFVIRIEPAV